MAPQPNKLSMTVLDDGKQLPDIPAPTVKWRVFRADVLLQFVSELPDGYRTVFNLYCIEGYSHRDIAQMLGTLRNEKVPRRSYSRRHCWPAE